MVKVWNEGDDIAKYIDHTLLKPSATEADIERLCEEALKFGFYSVCVNGVWVAYCREKLAGSDVKVAAVAGFPLGANDMRVKAFEAAAAAEDGATEIDMVLSIGHVIEGRFGVVNNDIARVVRAVEGQAIVKVIFETSMLDEQQIAEACRVSEAAGAHYVKTSTGFGGGGATEAHIKLMRANVSPTIGVKASGGIRDKAAALTMLKAGANRLGTSAGAAIVSGIMPPAGSPGAAPNGATPADNRSAGQAGNTQY